MKRTLLAAAAALVLSAPGTALAQDLLSGDPAKGKRLFLRCQACHDVGEGAVHKVGPALNDLFGRAPGALSDFNYSPAMVAFGEGKVWTPELLAEFIKAPRQVVAGTMMVFPGLRKVEDQADLIAYLAEFDEDGTASTAGPAE